MAKGVRGLWARLGTTFILTDARFVGRSDAAQSLFVWFLARVLDYHGEFLPIEYSDPKTISKLRGRTLRQTKKAIEELASTTPLRPLIGRIGQDRVRVCGQREKHGDQIGWRDEQKEASEWNVANPDDLIDPSAFTKHTPAGRPRNDSKTIVKHTLNDHETTGKRCATEQDVDVDVKAPEKSARRTRRKATGVPLSANFDTTSGITAPDGVVAEDWWRLLRMTAPWPVAGKDGGLGKLAAILKANGPKDAEAYIAKANRCWKAGGVKVGPWAIFATGFQPSDGDRDDGGGGGNRKVSRDAEAIGDVLAKGITG